MDNAQKIMQKKKHFKKNRQSKERQAKKREKTPNSLNILL